MFSLFYLLSQPIKKKKKKFAFKVKKSKSTIYEKIKMKVIFIFLNESHFFSKQRILTNKIYLCYFYSVLKLNFSFLNI